jgi:hypothetical protein
LNDGRHARGDKAKANRLNLRKTKICLSEVKIQWYSLFKEKTAAEVAQI